MRIRYRLAPGLLQGTCVMHVDETGGVSFPRPESLGISSELATALVAYQAVMDELYNPDYPPDSEKLVGREPDFYRSWGRALAQWLADELDEPISYRYWADGVSGLKTVAPVNRTRNQ